MAWGPPGQSVESPPSGQGAECPGTPPTVAPPHGQGPPSPHPPLELVLLFSSRPPGATGFPDPANCPERQAWVTGLGWGLQSLASLSNLGLPLFDE